MASNDLKLLELPGRSNILRQVGQFLSGRAISTFALTLATCNEYEIPDRLLRRIVIFAKKRCDALLEDAPSELQECWRILSRNLLANRNAPLDMRQLSEWCAVLDYCEQCPKALADFYQRRDVEHERKLWLVGGGNVRPKYMDAGSQRGSAPHSSQVILATHLWSPQLLCIGDDWLDPNALIQRLDPNELLYDAYDARNTFGVQFPSQRPDFGVISFRDANALRFTKQWVEVDMGDVIIMSREKDFCLIPSETLRIYRTTITNNLAHQDLSWMTELSSEQDAHMLCTWESFSADDDDDYYYQYSEWEFVQRGEFVEKILKLLETMNELW